MPKKIRVEDDLEEEDVNADSDEELMSDEEIEAEKARITAELLRNQKEHAALLAQRNPIPSQQPRVPRTVQQPQPRKERYKVFFQPQKLAVIDAESGEPVGEDEYVVLQTLANILERLERIENSIGAMLQT